MTDWDTETMGTNSDYFGLLVEKFITDNCHRDANRLIPAEELREAISKATGKPLNIRELGRVLNSMGIPRVRRRKKIQRYYAYAGLVFKPESPFAPQETRETIKATKFDGDTRETSMSTGKEKTTHADEDGDTDKMSVGTYNQQEFPESKIGGAWLGTD